MSLITSCIAIDTNKKRRILLCIIIWTMLLMLTRLSKPSVNVNYLDRSSFVEVRPANSSWNDPENRIQPFTINIWTWYFHDPIWKIYDQYDPGMCPWKCSFSMNNSLAPQSHMVLFNVRNMYKFLRRADLPQGPRDPKQIWTIHNNENPWHTYLHLEDYNHVFNWTSFSRLDSDLPSYYSRISEVHNSSNGHSIQKLVGNITSDRPHFAVWIVSNCHARNRRELSVYRLQQHIPIDIYGKCVNKPVNRTQTDSVLRQYKFYIAYENAVCRDYITEKFWRSLQNGLIPVVLGDSSAFRKLAPPNSYIDSADFAEEKDLAVYMRTVSENSTLYRSYFTWRSSYQVVNPFWCDLCGALHKHHRQNTSQVYTDLLRWQLQDKCSPWNVYDIIMRVLENARRLFYNNTPFPFPHQLYA